MRRIKYNNSSLVKTTRQKFQFMADRMKNLFRINQLTLPPKYKEILTDLSFENSSVHVEDSNDEDFENKKVELKTTPPEELNESKDEEKKHYVKYTDVSNAKRKLNRAVNKIFVKKKLGQVPDLTLAKKNSEYLRTGTTLAEVDNDSVERDSQKKKSNKSIIRTKFNTNIPRGSRLLNTQSSFILHNKQYVSSHESNLYDATDSVDTSSNQENSNNDK